MKISLWPERANRLVGILRKAGLADRGGRRSVGLAEHYSRDTNAAKFRPDNAHEFRKEANTLIHLAPGRYDAARGAGDPSPMLDNSQEVNDQFAAHLALSVDEPVFFSTHFGSELTTRLKRYDQIDEEDEEIVAAFAAERP